MILDRFAVIQSDALLLGGNAETAKLFAAIATNDSNQIAAAKASADTFARTVWVNAASSYRSIELRDHRGAVLVRLPADTEPAGTAPDNNAAHAAPHVPPDSGRQADEELPPLEFAVPGTPGSRQVGQLVMHLRVAAILPAQLQGLVFGRAGYLLVIDSLHQVLYDSRGGGSRSSVATMIRSAGNSTVLRYADGDSARLGSAAAIPPLGWTVISSAAISEFSTGLNSERLLELALVIALSFGVAAAFTVLIGRTTKSLEELTIAAKAVGQGDLVPRLPAASDDEIGTLAAAFDHMLGRVRTTMREIEVSRQLAVLGEFSAQLAHEIRNPLTSLKLNLQGLSRDVSRGTLSTEAGPPLETCLREVNRLDGVVQSVLELARPRSAVRSVVGVHALLDQMIEVHAPRLDAAGIVLIREQQAVRDEVQGDPEQLVGLFTNLLVNAIDAQPNGGRLLVRTRSNGSRIKIVLADDGPGVSADLAERIFRPFVSGKPTGTGLGLPMALNVARDHQGSLELTPVPDGFSGAAFRVTLPLA
jgi:signal transduction histidine kinase